MPLVQKRKDLRFSRIILGLLMNIIKGWIKVSSLGWISLLIWVMKSINLCSWVGGWWEIERGLRVIGLSMVLVMSCLSLLTGGRRGLLLLSKIKASVVSIVLDTHIYICFSVLDGLVFYHVQYVLLYVYSYVCLGYVWVWDEKGRLVSCSMSICHSGDWGQRGDLVWHGQWFWLVFVFFRIWYGVPFRVCFLDWDFLFGLNI